ncbi:MAG: S8 family serine peptidase [Desulfuromonadales bacterium]
MQRLRKAHLVFFAMILALLLISVATAAPGEQEADDEAVYLIQFEGAPLATYKGTVKGLAATNPRVAGTGRLDLESAAARNYMEYLRRIRTDIFAGIEEAIGRRLAIMRQFDITFHGAAVRLTAAEAARVAKLPGVIKIQKEKEIRTQQLEMSSPAFQGSPGGYSEIRQVAGWMSAGLILSFFLLFLALFDARRRRRVRSVCWIVAAAGLVLISACGGSDDNHVRIDPPGEGESSPGAALMNAPQVWAGSEAADFPGTMGEGVVVGIIDSGINPHSPSFAEKGEDGYRHRNPRDRYFGVCDPENIELYNPNFPCNEKLIGAWALAENNYNPVDFVGHGSHVAATAAGNIVREATVHFPSGLNLSTTISGVAPHASIISYNVANSDDTISNAAIIAAIEQTVIDSVDVINLSLGTGSNDPWQEATYALPLLGAREAGIHVAVSAGNSGPDPGTVSTPGVIPWLTTVGSSTHDLVYINKLLIGSESDAPEEIEGLGLSREYGPAPVVYAGDYGDSLCEGRFTSEFDGQIVICDQGRIARLEKGRHVKANGAGGMVLAEVDQGDGSALTSDAHYLPAVHVAQPDADRLKEQLRESRNQGSDLVATISGTLARSNESAADVIAGYSSRGWNAEAPGVIKPDIVAPGSSIFAPVVAGMGYAIYNGTSMASPHVAGLLALIRAVHPDWTPAQAQSAIMMTATAELKRDGAESSATPFDAGAGRVDAFRAVQAGLILDEEAEDFEQADPRLYWRDSSGRSGDPTALNLASMGKGACIGRCSWTRVLRSVAKETVTWTVTVEAVPGLLLRAEPETFTLAPGESVEVGVEADASGIPLGDWAFGRLILTDTDGMAPEAGLPVAVRAESVNLPGFLEIRTGDESGSKSFIRFEATGISDLSISRLGLIPAVISESSLDSDPTPEDPVNMDGGVYLEYIDVPSDAEALVVDMESSDAPNLDLYVGKEDSTESLAQSAKIGSLESVTVLAPSAGRWWIAVHNPAPDRQADLFTLRYGVVSAEDDAAGNLTATPDRTDGSPFVITLDWDLPGATAGDHWFGAIVLGSSAAVPNDIGTVPVKMVVE